MMQEVEVLKTIRELICSFFSEEQFTLSKLSHRLTEKYIIAIMCGKCSEGELFKETAAG